MENKIKLLLVQCLNCEHIWALREREDMDSQVDCYECGYSNELTDIRIKHWEVEIEDYEGAPEDSRW
jgi:hypothetical protein